VLRETSKLWSEKLNASWNFQKKVGNFPEKMWTRFWNFPPSDGRAPRGEAEQ